MLDRITLFYKKCNPFSSQQLRFWVWASPDGLVFNQEIAVELVWLERLPVLHFVSRNRWFQRTAILSCILHLMPSTFLKNVEGIWSTQFKSYFTLRRGYRRVMMLNHECCCLRPFSELAKKTAELFNSSPE